METGLLLPVALTWFCVIEIRGEGSFIGETPHDILLLIGSGIITSTALMFFSSAAKRISLSSLGMCQYITPSLHVLIGILIYQEFFSEL